MVNNINLQNEVEKNLREIKATRGVENVVLTQRDGNPIQYSGVWLSKDEIFSVSAATSAIYNCGLELHKSELKYILIEGQKSKLFLTPLRNFGSPTLNRIISAQGLQGSDNEFFVAITTQPKSNIGGILLKTKNSLIEIKKSLILSGESFKPPLRRYTHTEIRELLEKSNTKDDLGRVEQISTFSMDVSPETYFKLEKTLQEFGNQTLDLINSFVSLEGGFIISSFEKMTDSFNNHHNLDSVATMSYSIFTTANKCAWMLKKMSVDSILLECNDYFQFIHKVGKGIFSAKIAKGRQKLGLLRFVILRYCKKLEQILASEQIKMKEKSSIMDFSSLFSEIVF